MNKILYALDFDGVICDSAIETGITGWKAATQLWDDMPEAEPPSDLIDKFRELRPMLETGYEAILMMRLFYEGESPGTIIADYERKMRYAVEKSRKDIATLKKIFGETRDHWIKHDSAHWVSMNPLFPGVAGKLQWLAKKTLWYIVTTKQERFVKQILDANQIQIPAENVFGLERKQSKSDILLKLLNRHPDHDIYFVEDRLPTLLKVLENRKLSKIKLFFASWGYNTDEDKTTAQHYAVTMLNLEKFLASAAI